MDHAKNNLETTGKERNVHYRITFDLGGDDFTGLNLQKSIDQSGEYDFPQNYQSKFGDLTAVREQKGEITAFLSLIFVLMFSFILAMSQSASIQMTKNLKRLDADRAAFSVFGEYQRELWETYGIFAVDSTYGSGRYDESLLLNRLSYYGAMGIDQEITDIQLLTDNGGQPFREQVLAYMEECTGISLIRDLTGIAAEWEEQEIQGREISGELDEVLSENEDLLPEETDSLLWARKNGLLSLVLPKDFVLSEKSVSLSEQVSVRNRQTGRGSFPAYGGIGGLEERLLFEKYIMAHFNCAAEIKTEGRSLDYELEYLLCGRGSDTENLREVVNRLLFFRFAANYMYLLTDSEKQSEAEMLAAAIAILALQPEAAEVLKQILLILWAFGESVMDLRELLAGGRIVLVKTSQTWQLNLSNLFQISTKESSSESEDTWEGLTYAEYLQILLLLQNDETLTMRTLDRVEQNIRQESGMDTFRADACVTKLKLKNIAEIGNGYTYTFPLYFGYL